MKTGSPGVYIEPRSFGVTLLDLISTMALTSDPAGQMAFSRLERVIVCLSNIDLQQEGQENEIARCQALLAELPKIRRLPTDPNNIRKMAPVNESDLA